MCHLQRWLCGTLHRPPNSTHFRGAAVLFHCRPGFSPNISQGSQSRCAPLPWDVGMKEGLTEFSFSCSPSPLGREDLLLEEFLFGVEVMAPAFLFTVSTSQLAWSSLCVLFPALMTLKKKSWSERVISGKLRAQSQGSTQAVSITSIKLKPHFTHRTLWSWCFTFPNTLNF